MLKNVLLATAVAITAPLAATAATVNGQIDITGTVNLPTSSFTPTGNANLSPNGIVQIALGDFSGIAFGTLATLTDIDFNAPGQIWSVGGFTFTATSFSGFENTTTKAFTALGNITGNGFDVSAGQLTFSAQTNTNVVDVSFSTTTVAPPPSPVPVPAAGLLLLSALGGAVALRRKS